MEDKAEAEVLPAVEGVEWRFTSIAAPVQIEGTVDGHSFYFRARGKWVVAWIAKLGIEAGTLYASRTIDEAEASIVHAHESSLDGFWGSWMPTTTAVSILLGFFEEFRAGHREGKKCRCTGTGRS